MKKLNFLFWNVHRDYLLDELDGLIADHDLNVIILAETPPDFVQKVDYLLNKTGFKIFPCLQNDKIKIFSNLPSIQFRILLESHRYTIRQISLPGYADLILAAVHLESKRSIDPDSQAYTTKHLAEDIIQLEKEFHHNRSLVVGDFNMNPFENGMTTAVGLHGTMDRILARKKVRVVQGREFPYFYNPMWSFMGDLSKGNTSGSHFYSTSSYISYDWNVFDQILLRPDLIDQMNYEELEFVTHIESTGTSLLNKNGRPKQSDHLPLKFSLTLNTK